MRPALYVVGVVFGWLAATMLLYSAVGYSRFEPIIAVFLVVAALVYVWPVRRMFARHQRTRGVFIGVRVLLVPVVAIAVYEDLPRGVGRARHEIAVLLAKPPKPGDVFTVLGKRHGTPALMFVFDERQAPATAELAVLQALAEAYDVRRLSYARWAGRRPRPEISADYIELDVLNDEGLERGLGRAPALISVDGEGKVLAVATGTIDWWAHVELIREHLPDAKGPLPAELARALMALPPSVPGPAGYITSVSADLLAEPRRGAAVRATAPIGAACVEIAQHGELREIACGAVRGFVAQDQFSAQPIDAARLLAQADATRGEARLTEITRALVFSPHDKNVKTRYVRELLDFHLAQARTLKASRRDATLECRDEETPLECLQKNLAWYEHETILVEERESVFAGVVTTTAVDFAIAGKMGPRVDTEEGLRSPLAALAVTELRLPTAARTAIAEVGMRDNPTHPRVALPAAVIAMLRRLPTTFYVSEDTRVLERCREGGLQTIEVKVESNGVFPYANVTWFAGSDWDDMSPQTIERIQRAELDGNQYRLQLGSELVTLRWPEGERGRWNDRFVVSKPPKVRIKACPGED